MLKRLPRVQLETLAFLVEHTGTTYREIADELGASLNGVYMATAHLFGRGYIEEQPCPTCGRSIWVVTPLGKAALQAQNGKG